MVNVNALDLVKDFLIITMLWAIFRLVDSGPGNHLVAL
jgi:hypothetical protein